MLFFIWQANYLREPYLCCYYLSSEIGAVNYSKATHEEADRVYETLKESENNVGQPGTTPNTYSDPNVVNTPLSEQDCAYAEGIRAATQTPDKNRQVYQNIAQPAQSTGNHKTGGTLAQQELDEDFYNYPDNYAKTAKPASELEYTYAKDTNVPTAAVNKKGLKPKDNAGQALYHTLKQEQSHSKDLYNEPGSTISTQLENAYAKDTESPIVRKSTPYKKDTIPQSNDPMYQVLEQEGTMSTQQESPEAPFYSTLEEPEKRRNLAGNYNTNAYHILAPR